jgi:uncharacterized Zn finger protein
MMPLSRMLGRGQVMALAGPAVYARGWSYHRDGRVSLDEQDRHRVVATVRGTLPYTVEVRREGDRLAWACTCPAAEDGSFCKHAAAVACEVAEPVDDAEAHVGDHAHDAGYRDRSGLWRDEVTGHLATLERGRLEGLVLDAAGSDWRLRERLLTEVSASRGDAPDLERWRDRIDVPFAPFDDFVGYQEASAWAAEVGEVIDALAELCDAGQPDAAAVLAEHAHRRADEAIQYVDDSDGRLTDISERLSELHLRGCREGSSDPVELAHRLVELRGELDGCHRSAARYAGGARGGRSRCVSGPGRPALAGADLADR